MTEIISILSAGGVIFAGIAIVLSIIAAVAPLVIMIQLRNINRTLKEIKKHQVTEQINNWNKHQYIMDEFKSIKYKIGDTNNEENTHE